MNIFEAIAYEEKRDREWRRIISISFAILVLRSMADLPMASDYARVLIRILMVSMGAVLGWTIGSRVSDFVRRIR